MAAGAWLLLKAVRPATSGEVFWLLLALSASHLFIDWITVDKRPPYGVMLWWPLSARHYIVAHPIFGGLRKKDVADLFQWYNAGLMAREAAIMLPCVAGVLLFKRYHRAGRSGHSRPDSGARRAGTKIR